MTMKYKPAVTLERHQLGDILANMSLGTHEAVLWREFQKASAKKSPVAKKLVKRVRKAA